MSEAVGDVFRDFRFGFVIAAVIAGLASLVVLLVPDHLGLPRDRRRGAWLLFPLLAVGIIVGVFAIELLPAWVAAAVALALALVAPQSRPRRGREEATDPSCGRKAPATPDAPKALVVDVDSES